MLTNTKQECASNLLINRCGLEPALEIRSVLLGSPITPIERGNVAFTTTDPNILHLIDSVVCSGANESTLPEHVAAGYKGARTQNGPLTSIALTDLILETPLSSLRVFMRKAISTGTYCILVITGPCLPVC